MIRPLSSRNKSVSIVTKLKSIYETLVHPLELAVDLGTSTTRIGILGKGIVIKEPSYLGLNTNTKEFIFFGEEAKNIFGKTPKFVKIIKPIEHSILSDFDSCASMLKYFFQKGIYPYYQKMSIIKPGITIYTQVSSSATEVEQKATREVFKKIGCSTVRLIEKPFCCGAGAGMNIFANTPTFIIDLGAGSIEMAVIIMGGIVSSKTLKFGGDYMDKLITNYIHLKYGIIAGEQTIERLKIKLFNLRGEKELETIRGKSLENGLPKSVRISSGDIREALAIGINQVVDGIKELLETIPPEIVDGVVKNGAMLTGELAHIEGLSKYITRDIKIPVDISYKSEDATIQGIIKIAQSRSAVVKLCF